MMYCGGAYLSSIFYLLGYTIGICFGIALLFLVVYFAEQISPKLTIGVFILGILFILGALVQDHTQRSFLKEFEQECEATCDEGEDAHLWTERGAVKCTCSKVEEEVVTIGYMPCR